MTIMLCIMETVFAKTQLKVGHVTLQSCTLYVHIAVRQNLNSFMQ